MQGKKELVREFKSQILKFNEVGYENLTTNFVYLGVYSEFEEIDSCCVDSRGEKRKEKRLNFIVIGFNEKSNEKPYVNNYIIPFRVVGRLNDTCVRVELSNNETFGFNFKDKKEANAFEKLYKECCDKIKDNVNSIGTDFYNQRILEAETPYYFSPANAVSRTEDLIEAGCLCERADWIYVREALNSFSAGIEKKFKEVCEKAVTDIEKVKNNQS